MEACSFNDLPKIQLVTTFKAIGALQIGPKQKYSFIYYKPILDLKIGLR